MSDDEIRANEIIEPVCSKKDEWKALGREKKKEILWYLGLLQFETA